MGNQRNKPKNVDCHLVEFVEINLWIVLGKKALHMTHPTISPSLMFSMTQWGLCHMAKLVLYKVFLCTPDLALKFLNLGEELLCMC
jgi:hypothetical protein